MTSLKNFLTGKKLLSALICASAFGGVAANACTGALDGQTNAVGTHNGYYYSFWTQTQSRVSITCGEGGNYSTDWSGVFNWVGGKGWKPGGPRVVNYSGSFNNGQNQGQSNSYLALYGWTRPPVEVEYYVVESYGSYNPANCGGGGGVAGGGGNGDGMKGSFQSDGATYDVVQCTRTNQPSISGTSTFKQFFSVRNPPKPWGDIGGTITVQNHFDAWQKFGMQLGSDFDYMVLATEGYDGGNNSSGNSNLMISEGGGNSGGGNNGGDNGWDNGGNNGGGNNGGGNNGGGNNGGDNGWDNGGNNDGGNNGGATAGDAGSIVVRARGAVGGEHIDLIVGGNVVAGWDLSTTARDYTYSGNASGEVEVEFTNDSGDLDVVLDYVSVYGDVRQAEDMQNNTAAYDGSCGGGSYTENMHCNGVISFGDSGTTGGGNANNGGGNANAGGGWNGDQNGGGNNGWNGDQNNGNNGWNGDVAQNGGGNQNVGGGGTCNWYGTSYPMCNTTASGWGWENNQSCISQSTCSSQ